MSKKLKVSIRLLFILSIILILGAPYFPSFLYSIIYLYDFRFQEFRTPELIPSIRLCGVVLSAWGIVLLLKSKHIE